MDKGNRNNSKFNSSVAAKPFRYSDLKTGEKKVLFYHEFGVKNCHTLIFIHGLGGRSSNWELQIESLSNSYRVIILDLPGYGESSFPTEINEDLLNYFCDAVYSFCESENNAGISLVGHSMGGHISLLIANQGPRWLKNLILLAPAGIEDFTSADKQKLMELLTPEFFFEQDEKQIRNSFKVNFFKNSTLIDQLINERLEQKKNSNYKKYCELKSNAIRSMLNERMRVNLDSIEVPICIMFGKQDQLIPNRMVHQNLQLGNMIDRYSENQNIQMRHIENAGHMLQIDQHQLVNNEIREFIDNSKFKIPTQSQNELLTKQ